ncbi:N-acetylglucosamine-6-phosphate deacetylase [hydrothermal vent metagenome]|uniref:N-acetylglucosamine-6-phosphate deacetylase n=1 Tax=hydrothermal vent metagenome TaxID=652676 RepID=A0A3B0URF5_9ZZZZ
MNLARMNNMFALGAPRIFDGQDWHHEAALIISNGLVVRITPIANLDKNIELERLDDGFIAPGLVDIQVNGGGGVLFNNKPSVTGIRTICQTHIRFGITSLLTTLITDTPEVRNRAIAAAIAAIEEKIPGFAGLHLEGPHISLARKGAHDPELIRPMNQSDLIALVETKKHLPVLLTTIAAEAVTPEQVSILSEAGIIVAIGHCDAPNDKIMPLVAAGATIVTHLFNAMSQISAREPGMVGAALSSPKLHASLIADGFHVHPALIKIALGAKAGPGRVFLISDAMLSVGADIDEFVLNNRRIKRQNGKLTLDDGTLAGADLDLARAVGYINGQIGVELGEALRMASLYPAIAAQMPPGVGRLGAGLRADLVWFSDQIKAQKTWIGGIEMAAGA